MTSRANLIGGLGASAVLLAGGAAGLSSCPGPTPPSEPLNPAAVAVMEVPVSWAPVDGATSYRIYRSNTPGDERFVGTSDEASFTDEVPDVGQSTLYYQIAAVNDAGEGPRSAEIAVVVGS